MRTNATVTRLFMNSLVLALYCQCRYDAGITIVFNGDLHDTNLCTYEYATPQIEVPHGHGHGG